MCYERSVARSNLMMTLLLAGVLVVGFGSAAFGGQPVKRSSKSYIRKPSVKSTYVKPSAKYHHSYVSKKTPYKAPSVQRHYTRSYSSYGKRYESSGKDRRHYGSAVHAYVNRDYYRPHYTARVSYVKTSAPHVERIYSYETHRPYRYLHHGHPTVTYVKKPTYYRTPVYRYSTTSYRYPSSHHHHTSKPYYGKGYSFGLRIGSGYRSYGGHRGIGLSYSRYSGGKYRGLSISYSRHK